MQRLKKSFFSLLIFLFAFPCFLFAEESLTITTYYPSPYGSYNELSTTGNTYLATSGGYVGIGTTNPLASLAIASPSLAIGSNQTYGYNVYIGTSSPTVFLDANVNSHIQLQGRESGSAKTIKLSSSGSGNLAIMPGDNPGSGNVGIGTANPIAKFTIALDGQLPTWAIYNWARSGLLIGENTDYFYVGMKDEGSDRKDSVINWGDNTNDYLRFIFGRADTLEYNEVMRLTPSGNVGIGTTAPTAKLEVKGQYFSAKYTTTTTLDWNNGNVQYIQLASGAQAFTFTNGKDGGRYILILKQPAGGAAGTVTWPATVLWPGGTAPSLTTTNSKVDVITFVADTTNTKYYGGSSLNY